MTPGDSNGTPHCCAIRGTDRNPVIHLCTEDQARREACSARDRAGQPAGATHASPLRINPYSGMTGPQFANRIRMTGERVGQVYRLRWQVELWFEEWKSYANLHAFDTKNAVRARVISVSGRDASDHSGDVVASGRWKAANALRWPGPPAIGMNAISGLPSSQCSASPAYRRNIGAATPSISTFTHAGRPLASALARAASRSAGSVTCSP